jgi:DNA recombination protein RmuC
MLPWLLAIACAAALVVAIALLRRRPATDPALMRELGELRARLDALAGQQQAIPQTVASLTESVSRQLQQSGTAVGEVRDRLGHLAAATERLQAVGQQVAEVQELLRVPKLRGTLGEVWLEELLRQVFPASQFTMQYTFPSGERVDAVVRVGDRLLPVDAKFPLEAFQRMLAAEGDAAGRERRAFARSLRARIDEIADRYIRPDAGTFEFALMYLPSEAIYHECVIRGEGGDDGAGVIAHAMDRRVIPVSPQTFYAYLSSILHGLKGLRVEARAREILAGLGALRQDLDRLGDAYGTLGTHLGHALRKHQEGDDVRRAIGDRVTRLTGEGDGAADL